MAHLKKPNLVPAVSYITTLIQLYNQFSDLFLGGLSKFAKLARSVTRSRSALASQLSNQVVKEPGRQSNLTQVSKTRHQSY